MDGLVGRLVDILFLPNKFKYTLHIFPYSVLTSHTLKNLRESIVIQFTRIIFNGIKTLFDIVPDNYLGYPCPHIHFILIGK